MARPAGFAPLTDALIRRGAQSFDVAYDGASGGMAQPAVAEAGWRDDLRLFALTWAAGFVFFLTLLA